MLAPLLGHAGGFGALLSTVAMLGFGIAVVFVLVVLGRIELRSGSDLVLPLAAVAVVAGAAPLAGELLSDLAAPAAVAGTVLLAWLLGAAAGAFDPRRPAPVVAAVLVAAGAAALLGPPLADGPWRERSDAGQAQPQGQRPPGHRFHLAADHPGQLAGGPQADARR